MIILAVDTCLAACSVAVVDGETVLATASEPMMRGHQERLATLTRETMQAAGIGFDHLGKIAVTVGPGSFTGLRVGIAFAKGLAGALGLPLVGIGSLEALAGSSESEGTVVAAIDPKRGQIYLQAFRSGQKLADAEVLPLEEVPARLAQLGVISPLLVGPGAHLLAPFFASALFQMLETPDPAAIARLAASRDTPASPLYLRAPDARLPA